MDEEIIQLAHRGVMLAVKKGSLLLDLGKQVQEQYPHQLLAARINGELYRLDTKLDRPGDVEFITVDSPEGYQIYRRSLCFLMIKAAYDMFPGATFMIKNSLGKGIYCEWDLGRDIRAEDVSGLEANMRKLVEADHPFVMEIMEKSEATRLFKAQNAQDKIFMLRYLPHKYIEVNSLEGFHNYFNGHLVPSTGYLANFGVSLYPPGLLLHMPAGQGSLSEIEVVYKKISTVLREADDWGKYLGSQYVSDLNKKVQEGSVSEIIWLAEALHEKRVIEIADLIKARRNDLRVILIAGPSSSGKTTFAKRLMIQLRVNGLTPISISLDDYFLPREMTPKDEKGEYDFESINALDLPLFNGQLQELLKGDRVQLPYYSFKKGLREVGSTVQVGLDQPIIIEGIHGLNEQLTISVARHMKFKIYISALNRMGLDHHNIVATTDSRMIRRIVRDNQYRNYRAEKTINMWSSVRRGEERNIFPFQEEADIMFNSALPYELCVLRSLAEPLLKEIDQENRAYCEAQRLLNLLSYFEPVDRETVPRNSILREFVGGSYLP